MPKVVISLSYGCPWLRSILMRYVSLLLIFWLSLVPCAIVGATNVVPSLLLSSLAGDPGGVGGSVDNIGTLAKFSRPTGLDFDGRGSLYVVDQQSGVIRKLNMSTAAVVSLCGGTGSFTGNGFGLSVKLNRPASVA